MDRKVLKSWEEPTIVETRSGGGGRTHERNVTLEKEGARFFVCTGNDRGPLGEEEFSEKEAACARYRALVDCIKGDLRTAGVKIK